MQSPGVCQETIYRHVYSREGMREELWWHLPTHRMSRRPRRARKRLPPKFGPELSILFRPEAVAHRTEFGHWEGDLVLFQQKFRQANVTSLVERVSRFAVILKNTSKRSGPVMNKIVAAIHCSIGDCETICRKRHPALRRPAFRHVRSWLGARYLAAPPSRDRDAKLARTIRSRRTRKVPSRIPTVVPGAGSRENETSAR